MHRLSQLFTTISLALAGSAFATLGAQGDRATPRILIDEGHNEGHTLTGGYAGFAALVAGEGFRVDAHRGRSTSQSLREAAVLVIANPFPEPRDTLIRKARDEGRLLRWSVAANRSAFSTEEIAALRQWVEQGGALLLVLDHAPHGNTAGAVARSFDVNTRSVETTDSAHLNPPQTPIPHILFTRDRGLLSDHSILKGIDSVVTYGGGSLPVPSGGTSLLRIPGDRVDREFDETTQQFRVSPAGGLSQAVALNIGKGRVVVLGEAAMLMTDANADVPALSGGITNARIGNRRFAVRIIEWLAGR